MTSAIGKRKAGLREWRVIGKNGIVQKLERNEGGKPWVRLDRRNKKCKVLKGSNDNVRRSVCPEP